MNSARGVFALGAAAALASCQTTPALTDFPDLLIMNGTLYDGSGADGRSASVLIDDGKIVRTISENEPLPFARKIIDARGLVVAPGFIDPHTHAASDLASDDERRRANLAFAFQGVTTVVVGNDGSGAPDIAAQAIAAREDGIGTNVAYLAGFGPIRETVIGDANRAPMDAEIDEMRKLTRQAMCEGAWGLSTGLYYVPQNYAASDELTALAKEVSALGGYYDTHMRDESTYNITVEGALAETLEIGRDAQIPVHIAHIKALGPAVWGHSARMIAMIEAAQAAGQRVTADQYPWEASGTRVSNALVPRWALEGGLDALRARLRDPEQAARIREGIAKAYERRGGADRLLVTGSLQGAETSVGSTLAEIAKKRSIDPVDAAISILMEGDARVASFNMSAADIAAFAAQDWVVTGSDGSTGHPRKYGSFPKAYQDLVNGDVGMSMARFVQRSSAQTADIIGLTDRGRIAPGLAADLVIFDPDEFAPRATYQSPRELSAGVRHLIVNGESVISDGQYTGALPGQPLLKQTGC
jgi:N-acyl-D-aspartate/D-glutamate deacylase